MGFATKQSGHLKWSVLLTAAAFLCLVTCPAAAQSLYVAGAIGADISFASGQESLGLSVPMGSGESLSGAARLGVQLEPRWGIELEVSRAAGARESSRPGIHPLAGVFPFVPEISSRARVTTLSTTASFRQQVSDNVALAYLGGVVFHRTDTRVDYGGVRGFPATISPGTDPVFPVGLVLPSARFQTVEYGAGPVVGFETHIRYGDHVTIIPGVRMHGLPASWLLRPSVAAGWVF